MRTRCRVPAGVIAVIWTYEVAAVLAHVAAVGRAGRLQAQDGGRVLRAGQRKPVEPAAKKDSKKLYAAKKLMFGQQHNAD